MTAVRPNVDIGKSLDHPPNEVLEAIPAGQHPVLWAWLDLNLGPHPDPKIHGA
jgi:hypothetical protein